MGNGIQTVGVGTATDSLVDIKAVFSAALLCRAEGFFLCHNHPSGNLQPSPADHKLTKDLAAAAKILKMKMFDHIILTSESYYSFNDNCEMP